MKELKLTKMPYAQACVIITDDGTVLLKSYETIVAAITPERWLTIYGLYSMTTRKHISAFLKEWAAPITYQTAKMIYNDNYCININTGEIVSI